MPLEGSWGLRNLIEAVDSYQKIGNFDAKYPVSLFESIVLAAAWLGELDQSDALLAKYETSAAVWPDNILARCGGHRLWANNLRRLMEHPEKLRETAEINASKLKVVQLPKIDMISGNHPQ
ncbi:hypothetical protein GCM10023212_40140 [Luteolibacter yonseiensis]